MRKLVWFFIILFAATLIVSVVAHFIPEVKGAVGGALEAIGGTIWTTASGTWAYLGTVAGASGLNFFIATLAIFSVGLVSASFMHKLWNRRPALLGGHKVASTSYGTFTPQKAPATPESAPVKQQEPVVPEQKETAK